MSPESLCLNRQIIWRSAASMYGPTILTDSWMPSGLVSKTFSFGAADESAACAVATASIEARHNEETVRWVKGNGPLTPALSHRMGEGEGPAARSGSLRKAAK